MQIQCPSKTFIVGEYAVLQGHPGILLIHEPYFTAKRKTASRFHPHSPAGAYLQQVAAHESDQIEFKCPHQNQGGFGGSSAEFLLSYCLVNRIPLPLSIEDAFLAHKTYLSVVKHIGSPAASGLDVLGQSQKPGIYYIHPAKQELIALAWPFSEHTLAVERTKIKTATHAHLANLPVVDAKPLNELVMATRLAIETADLEGLILSINTYQDELIRQNLTHANTQALLEHAKQDPTILAQKGCGALGSDVLLTLRVNPRILPV